MAYGTTTELVPYFDTSWAVLSTIGICYVFVGVMVAGIRGKVSALILVPIVVSAGCAIANGVHYYEAFLDCPPINQAVALVSSDIAFTVSAMFTLRVIYSTNTWSPWLSLTDPRSWTPLLRIHNPNRLSCW